MPTPYCSDQTPMWCLRELLLRLLCVTLWTLASLLLLEAAEITMHLHIFVYFGHLSSVLVLSWFITAFILSANSIPQAFLVYFLNIPLSANPHVASAFGQQDQVTGWQWQCCWCWHMVSRALTCKSRGSISCLPLSLVMSWPNQFYDFFSCVSLKQVFHPGSCFIVFL